MMDISFDSSADRVPSVSPLLETGPFVGGYAMIGGRYFVDAAGCEYHERRCNRDMYEEVQELLLGGFARVLTADGVTAYRDFVTGLLWSERPDDFFVLDFLRFFRHGRLFFLRVPGLAVPLAFREADVWLRGDVFQHPDAYGDGSLTIFVHRAMPSSVFRFCGYLPDKSKRLRPLGGDTHYYIYRRGGRKPVRTSERILPVDTVERMEALREYARQERDIRCSLSMKSVRNGARLWL